MDPWYPSNSGSVVPWFIVIQTHRGEGKKKGVEESQTGNQASIGNHKRKKKKDRQVYNQWYIRQICRHLLNMRQKPTERLKNPNQVTINEKKKRNERNDHFSLIHFIISITLLL